MRQTLGRLKSEGFGVALLRGNAALTRGHEQFRGRRGSSLIASYAPLEGATPFALSDDGHRADMPRGLRITVEDRVAFANKSPARGGAR